MPDSILATVDSRDTSSSLLLLKKALKPGREVLIFGDAPRPERSMNNPKTKTKMPDVADAFATLDSPTVWVMTLFESALGIVARVKVKRIAAPNRGLPVAEANICMT